MFGYFGVFADSKTKAVTAKQLDKRFKWILTPLLSISPVVCRLSAADKDCW